MEQALRYLAELQTGQWHNLNDIPKDLFKDAWDIIDQELLDGYRFTFHEVYNYLVMKTKRADKEVLVGIIEQIKRDVQDISWLWCVFSDNKYILEVGHGVTTKGYVERTSDPIFKSFVGKSLEDSELLKFLYKNCINIKIVYLREESENV